MPIYMDLGELVDSLNKNDSTLFMDSLEKLEKDLVYLEYYGKYLSSVGYKNNISGIVSLMKELIVEFRNAGFKHIRSLYMDNTGFYTELMALYNGFKNRAYEVSRTGIDAYSDLYFINALKKLLAYVRA